MHAIEVDGGTRGRMGPTAVIGVRQEWDEAGADGTVGSGRATHPGAISEGHGAAGWEDLGGDRMDNPLLHRLEVAEAALGNRRLGDGMAGR